MSAGSDNFDNNFREKYVNVVFIICLYEYNLLMFFFIICLYDWNLGMFSLLLVYMKESVNIFVTIAYMKGICECFPYCLLK